MALLNAIQDTFCLLAPWLLLGAAIAGALHVLLPKSWLQRRLSGVSGIFQAVALGVPLPLCSCGVIPAGVGLNKSGASKRASIAFLISTPQTGVDSILVSASFLGWPLALAKVVVAIVTGIVGGLLTRDDRPQRVLPTLNVLDDAAAGGPGVAEGQPESPKEVSSDGHRSPLSLVLAAVEHALDVIRSIWVWLLVGVLVSAVLEVLVVPSGWFQFVAAADPIWSMLLILLLSVPLYVCATASVPIAAALVAGGMPVSAAIVFLIAGPATNVATIGAIGKQFGRRNLLVYLATIIGGSILGGLAFQGLFGNSGVAPQYTHHHEARSVVGMASAVVLLGIMGWCLWETVSRARRRSVAARAMESGENRHSFHVSGIRCQSCVGNIQSALARIPGVTGWTIDRPTGLVVVVGRFDTDTVRCAVSALGYTVTDAQPD